MNWPSETFPGCNVWIFEHHPPFLVNLSSRWPLATFPMLIFSYSLTSSMTNTTVRTCKKVIKTKNKKRNRTQKSLLNNYKNTSPYKKTRLKTHKQITKTYKTITRHQKTYKKPYKNPTNLQKTHPLKKRHQRHQNLPPPGLRDRAILGDAIFDGLKRSPPLLFLVLPWYYPSFFLVFLVFHFFCISFFLWVLAWFFLFSKWDCLVFMVNIQKCLQSESFLVPEPLFSGLWWLS